MHQWEIVLVCSIVAASLATAVILRTQQQIRRLRQIIERSSRDQLTGLPTRAALYGRLDTLRQTPAPYAVGLLNLDGFAAFNDDLHHRAGDQLLVLLVGRTNAHVTATGGELYRLGGDEFAVVWPDCDEATARANAIALLDTLEEPTEIEIYGQTITIVTTGCLGLACMSPHVRSDAGFVLGCADTALQVAKRHGPGIMMPWRPSMATARRRRGQQAYGLIMWSADTEPTLLVGRHDDDVHRQAVRVLTERLGVTAQDWASQIGGSPDERLSRLLPAPDHHDWDTDPQRWLEQLAATLTWPSVLIVSDVEVSR